MSITKIGHIHKCDVFDRALRAGDVFGCDECGKLWRVIGWFSDSSDNAMQNNYDRVKKTMRSMPLTWWASRKFRRQNR